MRSAEYLTSVVEEERSILTAGALCGGGVAWLRGGSWSGWWVARFQRTQRHLQDVSLAAFNLQFLQAAPHGKLALR